MINNLQVLRAFAALFIAYYHTAFEALPGIHGGYAGVPIFFVISGFVMCLVSRKDPSFFMTHRLIRIVPAYWSVTFLLALAEIRHVAFKDILLSLFFVPHTQARGSVEPIVGVGWTLNLEMYFYLLLALFLRLSGRFAPVSAGLTVFLVQAIASHGMPSSPLIKEYYANPVVLNFIYGIGVFYGWMFLKSKHLTLPMPTLVFGGWLGASVLVTLTTNDYGSWLTSLYPVIIVAGAVAISAMKGDIKMPFFSTIGDASYILYLIHTIVLEGLRVIFHVSLQNNCPGMLVFLLFVTVLSCGLHVYVERPVLRALKSRFLPQNERTATT